MNDEDEEAYQRGIELLKSFGGILVDPEDLAVDIAMINIDKELRDLEDLIRLAGF